MNNHGGAREGAGRKKIKEKKRSVTFVLSNEEINVIKAVEGKNQSEKLRNIINFYLENNLKK